MASFFALAFQNAMCVIRADLGQESKEISHGRNWGEHVTWNMAQHRVYLDANVYKFSATQLSRLARRQVTSRWTGLPVLVDVYDPVIVNPNERIKDLELKKRRISFRRSPR